MSNRKNKTALQRKMPGALKGTAVKHVDDVEKGKFFNSLDMKSFATYWKNETKVGVKLETAFAYWVAEHKVRVWPTKKDSPS